MEDLQEALAIFGCLVAIYIFVCGLVWNINRIVFGD